MNDKEYEVQKKRVKKLINRWLEPLGLRWWKMEFNYHREEKPAGVDPTAYSPQNKSGNWLVAMSTCADFYYLTASIDFYLPVLVELDDDEVEDAFIHECMHVLLRAMRHDDTAKEEELVATKLAQAFKYVYDLKTKK